MEKDFIWFKKSIAPFVQGFSLEYSFFKEGDFGNLNRVEFEGEGKIGTIDFWSQDWLEIHIYDCEKDQEMIHALLEPNHTREKNEILNRLQIILIGKGEIVP